MFLCQAGFGGLEGITEMELSGIDFADITDLEPLYAMDGLVDLRLVDTQNVDAVGLDMLLDNLETFEAIGTEGTLFVTREDFDAFNTAGGGLLAAWHAEPGHHVEFVPEPSTVLLLGLAAISLFTLRGPELAKLS
ncbi:PEP-CTERM sorting domain-containing protein [Planctomycetota bacterium]